MINTVGELVEELLKHDKNKPIFDLYGEPNRYHQERKIAKNICCNGIKWRSIHFKCRINNE